MKIINFIKKHKYIFIFLAILVCYIPYLLHFFPGIVISDTYSQMKQAMGLKPIDNHHPVFQTFTWWIFISIAKIFHNDNIAVLLNSLLQMISLAMVFTYSIYILDKKQIKNKFLLILDALFPIYAVFSVYTTKDTMFGVSIFFYIIELTKFVDNPKNSLNDKKNIILLLASMLLVILYKNNGIYIVLITQLIVLIYLKKEYFKKLGIILLSVLCFYLLWTNVVFSIFNIRQTEKVESLGVFVTQINYIVHNHQDNLPKGIKKEINNFIDYKTLEKIYTPTNINVVKKDFKENYYNNHKVEFLKLSFELFLKYPKESIKSFWLKNKRLLIPSKTLSINYKDKDSNVQLTLNNKFKNSILDKLYYYIILKPKNSIFVIFNFIVCPAINLYSLIILFIYFLIKRKKELLLTIPLLVLWLSSLVAPDTLYRYILPSVFIVPYLYYNLKIARG